MTMIEMSCHRKPLKVHRLKTVNCPSSFSERSSWSISFISSSTSSQPLSFCRAGWEKKGELWTPKSRSTVRSPALNQARMICKPWAAALPRREVRGSHVQRREQYCRNSIHQQHVSEEFHPHVLHCGLLSAMSHGHIYSIPPPLSLKDDTDLVVLALHCPSVAADIWDSQGKRAM